MELDEEIVTTSDACLGLLFRATERTMESKAPELLAGYFARLDYVSHLILEFGFCFGSMDYSPQLNLLGHQTLVANHLLNLGCTLADAGMVSAILWSFEVRDSGGTDRGSFWIPFTLQLCSLDFCFARSARL